MKHQNLELLKQNLVGKKLDRIEYHGAHGMVLTFVFKDVDHLIQNEEKKMDICTYDARLATHYADEFYVGLNGIEL